MILNNRQTAILYELIDNNDSLSYAFLCERFSATEKTIRNDIRKLNDFLNKDNIRIILNKGKGFNLQCSKAQKKMLKINFSYRYKDASDVVYSYSKRDLSMNYYLSKGYIKEGDIARLLNVSTKYVSNTLKDIRSRLDNYNIFLSSKPYMGIAIKGNEINIRNYLIDSASFMVSSDITELFKDDARAFNIPENTLNEIKEIFINSIRKQNITISQHGLIVMIVAFIFSCQRHRDGHEILYSDEQISLIKSFKYYKKYLRVINDLCNHFNYCIDYNDIAFIISYAICLSDDIYVDTKLLDDSKKYANSIMKTLVDYHICEPNSMSKFRESFVRIINFSIIRKKLNLIEYDYNNSLRIAMVNTPLSMSIGLLLFDKLEKELDYRFGSYILLDLTIALYNQIRYVTRTYHLCNIALFTPIYSSESETIVERIMYHCSNFIKKVDIVSSKDIIDNKKIDKYDLLLYYQDFEPIGLNSDIDKLQISYFFNRKDQNNLYDKLSVVSRLYKNCFGSLKLEDMIDPNIKINSLYEVVSYIKELCKDDELLIKQLEIIPLVDFLIYKDTYSIILFTDKDELKTSKLIKLNKVIKYNGQTISRVMVNIVNSDTDIRNIKTIESVIRKMLDHFDRNNISYDSSDLFSYFIKEYV